MKAELEVRMVIHCCRLPWNAANLGVFLAGCSVTGASSPAVCSNWNYKVRSCNLRPQSK